MDIKILSIEKTLFAGKASAITLPGGSGELTVLPGHVPTLTNLTRGELTITLENGQKEIIPIKKGYAEITGREVTVIL